MSQSEWNKRGHLAKKAAFPQPDDEARPQMAGSQKKRLPLWAVILLYVVEMVVVVSVVVTLWLLIGEGIAILGGIVVVMVLLPYTIRCAAQRLNKIRIDAVAAIRADKKPEISVGRVLCNYLLIFLPAYILAFGGAVLPYKRVGGILLVPAIALTIAFGIWHGSLWADLGWKRRYYILFLILPLALAACLGLVVRLAF